MGGMTASIGNRPPRVLIIVENLPVPFDRRVWTEALTLAHNGWEVSIICPKGKGAERAYEVLNGIHIYRHWLPTEADGALGYFYEYSVALFFELTLAFRVLFARGFDVIHACNPPDLIFLIGAFFKYFFGKKFVFDHHDINPELYEAKFGRKDFFWRLMLLLERRTFAVADISIATNESYKSIAIERGRMKADKVFVVRSAPDLTRVRALPADENLKRGRKFLVGYVGVIGKQEGIDLLLLAAGHIRHKRDRTDVQFIVVGSGTELGNLRAQSERMGLADFVTFTGRVDDNALFTALSTADICVNPDVPNAMNDKSTMNKIMEYMALGKAIVQFDLMEGRVSAGEASLYARNTDVADFGDKILELLDDPRRRSEMGRLGRERVLTALSWEHEAPRLLAAYRSLQHNRSGGDHTEYEISQWV